MDPGIYGTHLGANWRNFFGGTRAHNTVVVDDLDQSELLDVWRVDRQAQTGLHHWMSSTHFDFVDGSHDGYERLKEPITHRRQIFFAKPDYWIVVDWLSGQGEHCFDLDYHFMPDFEVELDEQSHLVRARGAIAALTVAPLLQDDVLQAEIIIAATDPIQGWVSVLSVYPLHASGRRPSCASRTLAADACVSPHSPARSSRPPAIKSRSSCIAREI